MSTHEEWVWDLYTLKKDLEIQLQDVEGMLRQALSDAYDAGISKLPNGYTVKRSEIRDISVRRFGELYPELYDRAVARKVAAFKPELTKTDIRSVLRAEDDEGRVLSKEAQEEILAAIETGDNSFRFSLTKPADPHAGEVVE